MRVFVCYRTIFLLWFLLSVSSLYGQSPAIRYYSAEQLGSSTVYSIVQDRRGFLWFGTSDGVTRFDGTDSQHYGIAEGLRNEFVITMTEAPDGSILLGTWGDGVYRLADGVCSSYSRFRNVLPQNIKFLQYDRSGRLWVGSPVGIGYIANNRYTVLSFGLPGEIYDLCERRNGEMLINTNRGIFCLSDGVLRRRYALPQLPGHGRNIEESPDGTLWYHSNDALYEIVGDTLLRIHRDIARRNPAVSLLKSDSRGRLWGAELQAGMFVWDPATRQHISRLRPLEKADINTMYEDAEGNMWIGTYGMGAVMVAGFRAINYTTEDGLTGNYILDIGGGPDDIALGTRNGVTIIENGSIRPLALPYTGDVLFLYTPTLEYDTAGALWISVGTLLMRRDADGRMTRETIKTGGVVRLLYCDKAGTMWAYSRSLSVNALSYYHNGRFVPWKKPPPMENLRIRALASDRTGTFWIATDSGAFACRGDTYRHYTTADGLPSNLIYDITENSAGVWLGTAGGLARLADGQWSVYTQRDGLADNRCSALLCDRQGTLWIGTPNGLNRFSNGVCTTYDVKDGLLANDIHVLHADSRNVLWVGTARGVTEFHINEPAPSFPPLPVYITGVRATGDTTDLRDNAELSHTRNSLHFVFTGLSYRRAGDVTYRYGIAGIDRQWQYTTLRSVHYSSLPPGRYSFLVQARSRYGSWGRSASFSFIIRPAFWETWWFRTLCILGAGGVIALAAQWQVRRAKKKQLERLAVQYRILQLEQQALQALMNPHFVFNALNSIHRYIRTGDETQAGDYLATFARLIRMTFENARNTWIVLEEELRRLELYLSLEHLRFGHRLTYSIHVDPDIDDTDIRVPSMILQPYVENAILHGIMPREEGGHVTIEIRTETAGLRLIIEDNGIGITAARAAKHMHDDGHRSSGMMLTEERLRLLSRLSDTNITLHISERPEDAEGRRGTRVEIVLPAGLADMDA